MPESTIDQLRGLLRRQVQAAEKDAIHSGGQVSADQVEALGRLARLVEIHQSNQPPRVRRRWPAALLFLATLLIVSVLLFAHVGETEIELDLKVSGVSLVSPRLQTLAAARGAILARDNALATLLRDREPDGPMRRGFDIGMGVCEGHTAWGPGKQKILDSLSNPEQRGFLVAKDFSLDRNNNTDFAKRGAAIADRDPVVANARATEPPGLYWLGFDIATGIFGDPALGAQGNTAAGPGSLGIRDKLSPEAQRGFNDSMRLHLGRNYRK
ncbi:MAG TPA: hypothetical protein VN851_08890 [Thermoanaerobaculia bacterium]|nr:hypothetical protein [Thermoanaerobaculia bacterium]